PEGAVLGAREATSSRPYTGQEAPLPTAPQASPPAVTPAAAFAGALAKPEAELADAQHALTEASESEQNSGTASVQPSPATPTTPAPAQGYQAKPPVPFRPVRNDVAITASGRQV